MYLLNRFNIRIAGGLSLYHILITTVRWLVAIAT